MKLSLKKRFGWIHVRGGALVKIVKSHAVHTRTHSKAEYGDNVDEREWVYCEAGDFAMEIVAVKTSKVLGHSYLSGPAIQLNRYNDRTTAHDDWFEPAALGMADLPDPRVGDRNTFVERFVRAMVKVKFGPLDVAAWRGGSDSIEDAKHAANHAFQAWNYEPEDGEVTTTHLIGMAAYGKTIKAGKRGGHVQIHIQPPMHQSDKCVSNFQTWMVLEAAERAKRLAA